MTTFKYLRRRLDEATRGTMVEVLSNGVVYQGQREGIRLVWLIHRK